MVYLHCLLVCVKMKNYILPMVSVVGLITTTGFAITDTMKVSNKFSGQELNSKKVLSEILPCYIRTGISFSVTAGCIIGAAITGNKQMAKVSAMNAVMVTKYADLVSKVKERDPELYSEIQEDDYYIFDLTGEKIRRDPLEIADAELQFLKEFYRQGCIPLKYYFELLDLDMPNYYEDMGYSCADLECVDIEYPIIQGEKHIVIPEPSVDYRRRFL